MRPLPLKIWQTDTGATEEWLTQRRPNARQRKPAPAVWLLPARWALTYVTTVLKLFCEVDKFATYVVGPTELESVTPTVSR